MSKRKPRNKLYAHHYMFGKNKTTAYFLDIGDGWLYILDKVSGKFKHTWFSAHTISTEYLIGVNVEYIDDSR